MSYNLRSLPSNRYRPMSTQNNQLQTQPSNSNPNLAATADNSQVQTHSSSHSLQPVAQSDEKQACSVYLEELRTEHHLSLTDDCLFSTVKVFRHARSPVFASQTSAPTVVASSPFVSASSSTPTSAVFIKLAPFLPKWNKESVCRPFLDQLTLVLSTMAAQIPSKHWIQVFPFVVSDVTTIKWIHKNIIEKCLD